MLHYIKEFYYCLEENELEKEVVRIAKQNLEEGESWHKKVNVREIVFGFNDGSILGLEMVFVGVLAAVVPYLIGDILLSSVLSQFVH